MDSNEKKEKLCKFVAVKEIRAAEDEVNPLKNSLIQLNSLRRFQIQNNVLNKLQNNSLIHECAYQSRVEYFSVF